MHFQAMTARNALKSLGFAALVAFPLLAPRAACAGDVAPDLQRVINAPLGDVKPVRVIVQFSHDDVNASLLALLFGGTLIAEHPLIDAATMMIPRGLITRLGERLEVSRVSPDRIALGLWDYDTESL